MIAEKYSAPGQFSFGYPEGVKLTDLVPEHMKPYVHEHWSQFPPVNPMWHYVLGFVYIILGFLSLFGNGMVMYLFMKTKNLQTPSNVLVVNLAFSDFLMLLSQFPFFAYNCFMGGVWMFSPFACELYAFFGAITGLCSIWSLVFISYDRYNVIVNGMSGKPLTKGAATFCVLFTWSYAIGWAIPPFFGWGRYIPEGILDSCSFDYLTRDFSRRSHGIALFVFAFCIPMFIIVFSYSFIVKAIFAHEAAMREQAKKMKVDSLRSGADANQQSAEVRIAKVAVTNVCLWIVCWVPYAAVVVQGLFFDQKSLTPIVSMLPALLCKTCSCYNPMVYAINHPKFRLAMQTHCKWFCIHEPEAAATNDSKSTATTNEKPNA